METEYGNNLIANENHDHLLLFKLSQQPDGSLTK
jgi:hypothetical protein